MSFWHEDKGTNSITFGFQQEMPQAILHWRAKEQLELLAILPVTLGEMQLIEQKKLQNHEFTKWAVHFRLPIPLMFHIT